MGIIEPPENPRLPASTTNSNQDKDIRECEIIRLRIELDEAYAELRKQRRTITAVYHREVWDRAERAGRK